MNQAKKNSLIWAIDPFEKDTRPSRQSVNELLSWAESESLELQPVYVTSSEDTTGATEKAAKQYLRDLGIGDPISVRLFQGSVDSRQASVRKLIQFAKTSGSPMIVVSSHGRTGIERLFLGSFAENLLRHSDRPVLFLNHGIHSRKTAERKRRVLFPTDFSDRSRAAFRQFLQHGKALRSELVLFYAVDLPAMVAVGYAPMASIPSYIPDNYMADQTAWAKREGDKWAKEAQAAGVSARVVVVDIGVGPSVARAILETAKKEEVDLIGMASVSGPVATLVAGSVAREVFRSNEYPVWVCG
ncbi:MAG: universal stress protein, partial [Bdellovibrionota bacterium]